MTEPTMIVSVSGHKVEALLAHLMSICEGPAEALGTICLMLLRLNEINAQKLGKPALPLAELVAEVSSALQSVEMHPQRTH